MDRASGNGVLVETDGVVEAEKDNNGHEAVPGQFDDDVGEHEGLPAVSFAGSFANFVESALCNKVRHYLLHELAENGEEQEDGEHLVLEALLSKWRLEKGEAANSR